MFVHTTPDYVDIEKIVDLWTLFNIEKEILENSDSKPVSSDIYLLIDEWSFFLPDNSIF